MKRNKSEIVIDQFKDESKILLKKKPSNFNTGKNKIMRAYKTQHLYFTNSNARFVRQLPPKIICYPRKRKQKLQATSTKSWSEVVHKNLTQPPNKYTT